MDQISAVLTRTMLHHDDGVMGTLLINGDRFYTLEPPNKGNRKGESCIPTGDYVCHLVRSPKFGLTYELEDVPGRSHILFHKGNTADDTEGCILVGKRMGHVGDRHAVTQSKKAFGEFMDLLHGHDRFKLEIKYP